MQIQCKAAQRHVRIFCCLALLSLAHRPSEKSQHEPAPAHRWWATSGDWHDGCLLRIMCTDRPEIWRFSVQWGSAGARKRKVSVRRGGPRGSGAPARPTSPTLAPRIAAPVSCAALITLAGILSRSLVECARCRGPWQGPPGSGPVRRRGPRPAVGGPRRGPSAAPTACLANGSENVKQLCPEGWIGGLLLWAAVWPQQPVLLRLKFVLRLRLLVVLRAFATLHQLSREINALHRRTFLCIA